MALATPSQMREYLRVLTGTAEDSLITSLVTRFDGVSAGWLGYPTDGAAPTLESATYTHYFDGDGGASLFLRVHPAISITTAHVDVDRVYGSSTLIAASDYELFSGEGLVLLKTTSTQGAWTTGFRAVKVVYVAGYSSTPAPIIHACGMQVAHWYRNRDNIGYQNVSQQGGSIRVHDLGLLEEVKEALAPYQLSGFEGGTLG
jgi:hypothetical protein